MAKKNRLVRLYTDVQKGFFWLLPFNDAKQRVEISNLAAALKNAKRGTPWECWLEIAIRKHANDNPEAFSHKVLHIYVIRSAIYLIDRYKNGQPSHTMRYFHNLSQYVKQFDRLSRSEFLKLIEDKNLTLRLRPAKHGGQREPEVGRRPSRNAKRKNNPQAISHGAMRRAKEAGLIPVSF